MLNKQKINAVFLSLCLALFCIFSATAHAQGSEIEALRPVIQTSELNKEAVPVQAAEPYVNRVGAVAFAADVFLPRKTPDTGARAAASRAFKGHVLSISFFPGEGFTILVDSESRPQREILSLNGKLQGQDMATFSLTVTPESFLILLQDLDTATVFRVVGDTESGLGQVTEIDLRKMPPRRYLPPIIPGEE